MAWFAFCSAALAMGFWFAVEDLMVHLRKIENRA